MNADKKTSVSIRVYLRLIFFELNRQLIQTDLSNKRISARNYNWIDPMNFDNFIQLKK